MQYSMNTPIKLEDLTTTKWKSRKMEFSVTFRSDDIGNEMRFTLADGIGGDRLVLGKSKVTGDWQTIKTVIPEFEKEIYLHAPKQAYAHLMLHIDSFSKDNYVDIKDFSIKMADE